MKTKIKCPKCNHEWETSSKLVLVTCPSCQLKVRNQVNDKQNQPTQQGEQEQNVKHL